MQPVKLIDPSKPGPELATDEKDIYNYLDPLVNVLFWVAVIGLPLYLGYHVALSVVRGVWP